MDYLADKIKELTRHLFEGNSFILVDLKVFKQGKKVNLRFLVDRATGGITVDECAQLNQKIGEALEAEQILQESYILEVSSPGADRPLVALDDFSRSIGRKIRLFLRGPVNGKIELVGAIEKVGDSGITLLADSGQIYISIDNIIKAKQTL